MLLQIGVNKDGRPHLGIQAYNGYIYVYILRLVVVCDFVIFDFRVWGMFTYIICPYNLYRLTKTISDILPVRLQKCMFLRSQYFICSLIDTTGNGID